MSNIRDMNGASFKLYYDFYALYELHKQNYQKIFSFKM